MNREKDFLTQKIEKLLKIAKDSQNDKSNNQTSESTLNEYFVYPKVPSVSPNNNFYYNYVLFNTPLKNQSSINGIKIQERENSLPTIRRKVSQVKQESEKRINIFNNNPQQKIVHEVRSEQKSLNDISTESNLFENLKFPHLPPAIQQDLIRNEQIRLKEYLLNKQLQKKKCSKEQRGEETPISRSEYDEEKEKSQALQRSRFKNLLTVQQLNILTLQKQLTQIQIKKQSMRTITNISPKPIQIPFKRNIKQKEQKNIRLKLDKQVPKSQKKIELQTIYSPDYQTNQIKELNYKLKQINTNEYTDWNQNVIEANQGKDEQELDQLVNYCLEKNEENFCSSQKF